jgi:CspA family cold shock protein
VSPASSGTVTAFDDRRGLGVVATAEGVEYPFHCTQIADGTRTIPVGMRVRFDVVPGHLGRWEATAVTPA